MCVCSRVSLSHSSATSVWTRRPSSPQTSTSHLTLTNRQLFVTCCPPSRMTCLMIQLKMPVIKLHLSVLLCYFDKEILLYFFLKFVWATVAMVTLQHWLCGNDRPSNSFLLFARVTWFPSVLLWSTTMCVRLKMYFFQNFCSSVYINFVSCKLLMLLGLNALNEVWC